MNSMHRYLPIRGEVKAGIVDLAKQHLDEIGIQAAAAAQPHVQRHQELRRHPRQEPGQGGGEDSRRRDCLEKG